MDEARNYFIEEIHRNDLLSKKHNKVYTGLNYINHLLILASLVTGCVSISDFSSLFHINININIIAISISRALIDSYIISYYYKYHSNFNF